LEENRTHTNGDLTNPHVRYEPGDVDAPFLAKFGIGMVFLIIVFCFGLWGFFDYVARRAAEVEPTRRAVNLSREPPEPHLQVNASGDYQQIIQEEERQMQQYAWVDPDKGIVRIPVARAMDLILQKGLPVLPPSQGPAQGKGQ
jgi:hypothetical protein